MNKYQAGFLAVAGFLLLCPAATAQAQTTRYWDTDGTHPGWGLAGLTIG